MLLRPWRNWGYLRPLHLTCTWAWRFCTEASWKQCPPDRQCLSVLVWLVRLAHFMIIYRPSTSNKASAIRSEPLSWGIFTSEHVPPKFLYLVEMHQLISLHTQTSSKTPVAYGTQISALNQLICHQDPCTKFGWSLSGSNIWRDEGRWFFQGTFRLIVVWYQFLGFSYPAEVPPLAGQVSRRPIFKSSWSISILPNPLILAFFVILPQDTILFLRFFSASSTNYMFFCFFMSYVLSSRYHHIIIMYLLFLWIEIGITNSHSCIPHSDSQNCDAIKPPYTFLTCLFIKEVINHLPGWSFYGIFWRTTI